MPWFAKGSLAGRIKEASKKGEAGMVQISPQHWVPEVQLAPFPSQLQTPLVQVPPSQQSLVLPQPWPISLHAQLPWVQAVP